MGCGKSILASEVICYLSEIALNDPKSSPACIYYYIDYTDIRTCSLVAVLQSLIFQLVRYGDVTPPIESLIRSQRDGEERGRPSSVSELIEIFLTVAYHRKSGFVVIDGLDELQSADSESLFKTLKTLLENGSSVFKIFLTSRSNEVGIFQDNTTSNKTYTRLRISSFLQSRDIDVYVQSSVKGLLESGDLVIGNASLEKEICHSLRTRADGM